MYVHVDILKLNVRTCGRKRWKMHKIIIVGSSGGNLYNQGGKEPKKLLNEIVVQANSAGIEVSRIVFVGANESMDKAKESTKARVFSLENGEIVASEEDSLANANIMAETMDKELAKLIEDCQVDGIVIMSADPKKTNSASIKAAALKKTPIVGTGGSSMANIQSMGANVVAVSGTTGTTNRTRAISAITTLSKLFGLKYRPIIGSSSAQGAQRGKLRDRISIRGIMMASLPGFISMALILALAQIPALASMMDIFNTLINVLPIVVAAVAAKQVSGLDEVGIVAGIIAGTLSSGGGIIGGIIGGILAGVLASYMIRKAFEWKIPGTTANIIGGGLAGLIAGLFVFYLIAPVALMAGNGVREIITTTREFSPILAGLLAGALIWPAIMGGVYHAAILPIVLLEMELTGMSFLGAVDMVGLVMVSAGITLANIVFPRKKENRAIAVPGFLINMGFGTFVEAAYPFMFSNKLVMFGAIFSSAIAGMCVGILNVQGTAYVPSIVGPSLSNNPLGFAFSMAVGLVLAFIITTIANKYTKEKAE